MLDAYWAAITKNVRVGQMGYVMSTQNPLRVAEETAIIDHLTRGRCFVGFARGYQSRWTNVIGQHLGTRATISPTAGAGEQDHMFAGEKDQRDVDDDATNRRIFEEEVDIVVKAWTEDSISFKGESWQIPFPFDKGVDDWPLARAGVTGRFGAIGEVGADGNVHRISVVPAPYTRPHPPVSSLRQAVRRARNTRGAVVSSRSTSPASRTLSPWAPRTRMRRPRAGTISLSGRTRRWCACRIWARRPQPRKNR